MHEDLVRSARRRCWAIAAVGLAVLTATIAIVVLPIAWILGALSTPFGTGLGYGWGLFEWAVSVSLALGGLTAVTVFAWSLVHAEAEALRFLGAEGSDRFAENTFLVVTSRSRC